MMWVPELSARDMKRARDERIRANAAVAFVRPRIPAGSDAGPTTMNSFRITRLRQGPGPWAMESRPMAGGGGEEAPQAGGEGGGGGPEARPPRSHDPGPREGTRGPMDAGHGPEVGQAVSRNKRAAAIVPHP